METVTMKNKENKLSMLSVIAYGAGEIPGAVNALLGAFLMMFYTDKVALSAGAIGMMFLVSKIFDGLTDLIAGYVVDNTKTKWGKARPWLLWLSVPTGLSIILIFTVPNVSEKMKLIYAFLTYNLFTSVFFTMTGVAKNSLMALLTRESFDRGKLAIATMFAGIGASVLGFTITMPFIFKLGGDIRAWQIVFGVYGIVSTLGLLCTFMFTKEVVEKTHNNEIKEKISFKEGIKLFFSNKYFIISAGVSVFISLAIQLNSGSQVFFYTYAMKNPMLMTSMSMMGLIPTIISIVFLAGISLKVLGKKKSIYLGATITVISFIIRGAAFYTNNVNILAAGVILGGLAVGPLSVPVNTFTADAVDYGEYKSGKRIEGIGSSLITFTQKISIGLSSAIIGWVLSFTGYVANNPEQTMFTKQGLVWMFAYAPAILILVVIFVVKVFYNYDKDMNTEI